jgi:hypothetical protein
MRFDEAADNRVLLGDEPELVQLRDACLEPACEPISLRDPEPRLVERRVLAPEVSPTVGEPYSIAGLDVSDQLDPWTTGRGPGIRTTPY